MPTLVPTPKIWMNGEMVDWDRATVPAEVNKFAGSSGTLLPSPPARGTGRLVALLVCAKAVKEKSAAPNAEASSTREE